MELRHYYSPDPAEKPLENLVSDGGFVGIFRRIAFVGDSGTDMTFAKNAGFLPIAAPWGYRSREELIECGAALVADDAAGLLQLLIERI